MTQQTSNNHDIIAVEETLEESFGDSWDARAEVLRERRMAAAKRRLDEIINP
jgi:hypothetical protein